jgi:hypothetical protein
MPFGRYIVDFVCFDRRLIIEVDGEHHADQVAYDTARTHWLESYGFRVLRFACCASGTARCYYPTPPAPQQTASCIGRENSITLPDRSAGLVSREAPR